MGNHKQHIEFTLPWGTKRRDGKKISFLILSLRLYLSRLKRMDASMQNFSNVRRAVGEERGFFLFRFWCGRVVGERGAEKKRLTLLLLPSVASSIVACSCHLTGIFFFFTKIRKESIDSLGRKCEETCPCMRRETRNSPN